MTPERLAALRHLYRPAGVVCAPVIRADVLALCDALTEAWAAIADLIDKNGRLRERAERLEAQLDDEIEEIQKVRHLRRENKELGARAERAEAMAQHHREFSDVYEQQRNAAEAALAVMRDRSERAEAEVEEIEGRMACLEAVRFNNDAQWQLALDALARVRALCDTEWHFHDDHGEYICVMLDEILAAIEGEQG